MGSSNVDAEGRSHEAPAVLVTVTRTGGFAGIRRQWRAEADERGAPRWVSLIQSCPWDEKPSTQPLGMDRFVFEIRARCGDQERAAELAEHAVQGPWRTLVDEVREAAADRG